MTDLPMTAAEQLISDNLGFAKALAVNKHKRLPPSFDLDDIVQLGYIGLWKAAQRFDASRNDNFLGWASRYINGEIAMFARRRQYRDSTHEQLSDNLDLIDHCRGWRNRPKPNLEELDRALGRRGSNEMSQVIRM